MEDACVRRLLQASHSAALEKSQAGYMSLEDVVLLFPVLDVDLAASVSKGSEKEALTACLSASAVTLV